VDVNEREIAEWRYLDIVSLESEVAASPENFTPWLKMEWAQITNSHIDNILSGPQVEG
jgi:isopentenyl-diphosphate delta-isomerase